jgi:hypothetical protein
VSFQSQTQCPRKEGQKEGRNGGREGGRETGRVDAINKDEETARHRWLMPVILATWEAEIRRMIV